VGKTGVANLPLHYGKAPRWLYRRMVKLADAIGRVIVYEYGEEKFLELISDPHWFQALSCVLGYDWHSSGTTTVTTAALKEAMEKHGIMGAGGKGMAFQTIEEIERKAKEMDVDAEPIKYASRMAAKIDSAALQDGYSIYHHAIFFNSDGKWAVVQQGMNPETRYARRYHWIWKIDDFIEEPHTAIVGRKGMAMDMTSVTSREARKISIDVAKEGPGKVEKDFKTLMEYQQTLDGRVKMLHMPKRINWNALREVYEIQPSTYEEMLSIKGMGAATVRALAYISDLIYGRPPSWKDPVKYSFAVGGKDGVPYPVNRRAMDEAAEMLQQAIDEAEMERKEKITALKNLKKFIPEENAGQR